MRIRQLRVTVVAAVIILGCSDIGRVQATDSPIGSGGTIDDTIWAGVQTSSSPSGTNTDSSGYRWVPASTYDAGIGTTTGITKLVGSIRYDLYERYDPTGSWTLVWIPRPSAAQLAQNAGVLVRGRLPQPVVRTAPDLTAGIVGVGMWMWVPQDWWHAVTAMAWVPTVFGSAWARTTATPISLNFVTQDDGTSSGARTGSMQCLGPGNVWTVAIGDEIASPCMYTYQHSSASRNDGVFVGIVSVNWEISWESNAGSGGDLPSYTTSTFMAISVDELQALIR